MDKDIFDIHFNFLYSNDLLKEKMFFASIEQAKARYEICKSCNRFNNILKTCQECRCFMPGKVALSRKKCPLSKWGPVDADVSISSHYTLKD